MPDIFDFTFTRQVEHLRVNELRHLQLGSGLGLGLGLGLGSGVNELFRLHRSRFELLNLTHGEPLEGRFGYEHPRTRALTIFHGHAYFVVTQAVEW